RRPGRRAPRLPGLGEGEEAWWWGIAQVHGLREQSGTDGVERRVGGPVLELVGILPQVVELLFAGVVHDVGVVDLAHGAVRRRRAALPQALQPLHGEIG